MKFLALIAALLFTAVAQATQITLMDYDPLTKNLGVLVSYQGQNNDHSFSLVFDPCETVGGVQQIAARLIDAQGDEDGDLELANYVVFDLSGLNCMPAELTVRSGRHHSTIDIY